VTQGTCAGMEMIGIERGGDQPIGRLTRSN